MTSIISENIKQEWKLLPIESVRVHERLRKLDELHVKKLMRSFEEMGGQLLIQPIVVDEHLVLVEGAHRLEAAKRSGWEMISAMVLEGLSDDDRKFLEVEANQIRLEFTTMELFHAWENFYKPRVQARRLEGQRRRGMEQLAARGVIEKSAITGISGNHDNERVSEREEVQRVTGMSIDTVNKIDDLKNLAHSETAPEELRQAAINGLKRLSVPRANVDAVYKSVVALQQRIKKQQMGAKEARREYLELRAQRLVEDSTGLSMKLTPDYLGELLEAARDNQVQYQDLQASRYSLMTAVARLMAVEALTAGDPKENLARVGVEAHQEIARTAKEVIAAMLNPETEADDEHAG